MIRSPRPLPCNNYGPPRVADLDDIVMGNTYQRAHVITEGVVSVAQDTQGQYWTLTQDGATVLLIPGRDFVASDLPLVVGKRTEVRGVVRMIRKEKLVGGVDLDLRGPHTPTYATAEFRAGVAPDFHYAFAIRDRTTEEFNRNQERSGGIGQQILDEPSAYSGKMTRIYGQFRGWNLFGDLPPTSVRGKDD